MENQAAPSLLNLFSERLLVTGALDLLNEALTQATLYLEKCLVSSNQQEPNSLPSIPKVNSFLVILVMINHKIAFRF